MCCLFTTLLILGPRVALVVWWLFEPGPINNVFSTLIWPFIGLIFVPWTTLAYVLLYQGGIYGLDWIWLGLALLVDLGSWSGGAYGNRERIPGYE